MRAGLTKGDNADGNKRRFLNSPDFATYVENGKDIALKADACDESQAGAAE